MLSLLPTPGNTKTGWPWTVESDPLPTVNNDGNHLPRISIITPSFNQGQFLEETIRSVLLQNYPNLEYIIIDGGSTDNSLEIIKKYKSFLTFWVSETDRGQSHAINKGFDKCTGELVNWICSDDLLCKNALNQFVSDYYSGSSYLYIGKCHLIDKQSNFNGITSSQISGFDELMDLSNHWRKNDSIAQQSALYPLSHIKKIGGVNESNHYTMDFELWGDLLIRGVQIKNIPLEMGMYRWYAGQKTSDVLKATNSLVFSALRLIKRNNKYSPGKKFRSKKSIIKYYSFFLYHQFRSFIGIRRRVSLFLKNGI